MLSKIYFLGACEEVHFQTLSKIGTTKFILDNNPSSPTFTTMKVMRNIFSNLKIKDVILTNIPSSIEEFNYYQKEFNSFGILLKFLDDFDEVIKVSDIKKLGDIDFHNNKIIIFDLENYFSEYRIIEFNKIFKEWELF